ncbi:MAG TPA: hypothetical protein VIN58_02735 [Roseateles sp.]
MFKTAAEAGVPHKFGRPQSEGVIKQLIQSEGLQVRMLPTVFAEDDLLVACSPQLDNGRFARLSAAMSELEADGTAVQLRATYGL